jgi:VWFA-related protein
MHRLTHAGFLLPAITLLAQDQNPTIRVTTRLVQVNVVVHKKGEPVSDLKKEDFTIFDKGKELKVAVFAVDSIDAPPKAWPPLPPNIFSNRVQRNDTPTSITVILMDGLNTRFEDQAYSRKQIVKFLSQLQPHDRVAIYLLGSNLRILHDFTNDSDHLAKALAKYQGRISGELDAADPAPQASTGNDDLDQFLSNADQAISDFQNVNRAQFTLDAMEAIAHHLAAMPGRKNLVWVSGGFPFTLGLEPEDFSLDNPNREHRTFNEETTRVARAMNDANIAIYPVDARGLITNPNMSASMPSRPIVSNPRGRPGPPPAIAKGSFIPANHDTMQILAERTGGKAFYNTNDLAGAVRNAVNDARVTYTLGFYPVSEDWDGKFHEIKVKVDRPGVDVRYRKGFVAFTAQTPSPKEIKAEIQNALATPLEGTGIGVNARIDTVDKPKPGSLQIVTQIDQANIVLQPQNDRWAGALEVGWVQVAADGKILNVETQALTMNLKKERYDDVQKHGLIFTKVIEPVENAFHLRIIVVDHATGNVGSLQIPIKVPAPKN